MTFRMPLQLRPPNWQQLVVLRRLSTEGAFAEYDRWRALIMDGKRLCSPGSTIPYTLFIRGAIVSDGEKVTITQLGRDILKEIEE